MAPLAAVTGATGFLGRHLVRSLSQGRWRVRVLVRRPAETWEGVQPETVVGSLDDADALQRLTAGADVVVHGAGLISARDRQAFWRVNVEGAGAVARAARSAGRILMISSLAAREPQLSDYAASKRAGEAAMREALGDRLTIVRPAAIYGPGDRATLPLFRFAASSPVLPALGEPGSHLALAHVSDVAAAIASLASRQAAAGTFAVGGAQPSGYRWEDILTTLAAALGRSATIVQAPGWLVTGAGALCGLVARATGRAAIFNSGKAREMLHADWSVSPGEMAPDAPAPVYDLAAGFRDTAEWYRSHGWL